MSVIPSFENGQNTPVSNSVKAGGATTIQQQADAMFEQIKKLGSEIIPKQDHARPENSAAMGAERCGDTETESSEKAWKTSGAGERRQRGE